MLLIRRLSTLLCDGGSLLFVAAAGLNACRALWLLGHRLQYRCLPYCVPVSGAVPPGAVARPLHTPLPVAERRGRLADLNSPRRRLGGSGPARRGDGRRLMERTREKRREGCGMHDLPVFGAGHCSWSLVVASLHGGL